jgi:hypothetical protein
VRPQLVASRGQGDEAVNAVLITHRGGEGESLWLME